LVGEVRSNNNIVYQRTHHVVWCPKYRREVIGGRVEQRLKEITAEIRAERRATIIEIETMPDHAHPLLSVDPQFGIHRLVRLIKSRSPRLLPHLKNRLPTPRTNSYLVATIRGATPELNRYVEDQRNK
jgi:putative transposase